MNLYQPTITGSLSVSGSLNLSGSISIAGGGTISGTASIATTALTASFVANAQTASYVLNAVSSSFALTASSADNLLVRNTLTAQTLVVQTITSSVDFVTGSTRFGSLSSNTHIFTGSMAITGGLVDIIKDGQSLRIFPQTSSGSARIQLQNSGSGGLAGANAIIAVEDGIGGTQFTGTSPFSLAIGTATQKAFHLGANSVAIMTITGSNVGIGTSNPSYRLQIGDLANTSAVYNDVFITGDRVNNDGYYARLIFGNSSQSGGSTASIRAERKTSNYATELTFYTNEAGSIGNGIERLRIASNGVATFSSTISSTGATFSGDLNLSGAAEINHTGRMLFDAGAGNGFLFRVDNVATQALSIASTGAATFPVSVTSTKFNTFKSSLSVDNNTATFMQQCSADGGQGSIYLIVAAIGGAGVDRIAMGILITISQGGGTARWAFQSDGTALFLTDPGSNGNIYVRHTVGGTQTINYSILRIG